MDEHGLDNLVLVHDGMHSFLDSNPIFLACGFKAVGESMLHIRKDSSTKLFVTPSWDATRAGDLRWVSSVSGFDNFTEACVVLKAELHSGSSKTGVVGVNKVKRSVSIPFLSVFQGPPRYMDDDFYGTARRKTPNELENAKRATEIAERGYERLLEITTPGVRENQVAAELDCFMKSLGSDDEFLMLSASQHNMAIRPPMDRILARGDVLLTEISPSFHGQFIQICRTITIGERDSVFREKYSLLTNALASGMKASVPGATVAEVVRRMNEPFEKSGYGEYCHPPYIRVRGHGLGLASTSPEDLNENNRTQLENDMLFVMHPNQYLPETGYMMCGDPVVVTGGGALPLSHRPPALDAVGGSS